MSLYGDVRWNLQAGIQLILDTRPAGTKAAGGVSKEEVVDKICQDLLGKVEHFSFQEKIWQFIHRTGTK